MFLFLESHSIAEIRWKLIKTLNKVALSESPVIEWRKRFRNKDCCGEDWRRGDQMSGREGQERIPVN